MYSRLTSSLANFSDTYANWFCFSFDKLLKYIKRIKNVFCVIDKNHVLHGQYIYTLSILTNYSMINCSISR